MQHVQHHDLTISFSSGCVLHQCTLQMRWCAVWNYQPFVNESRAFAVSSILSTGLIDFYLSFRGKARGKRRDKQLIANESDWIEANELKKLLHTNHSIPFGKEGFFHKMKWMRATKHSTVQCGCRTALSIAHNNRCWWRDCFIRR